VAENEVWLIRHGATEWSRERRHTGRTDLPLEPDGEAAARALRERLAGVKFDLVLASPLQRAWQTARLAGLDPRPEPLAMEWDYGDYEGQTTSQVQERVPGWSIWTGTVPGGESLAQVAGRADALIERIRQRAARRAVLVAHAHLLRILAARWIGNPAGLAANLILEPAGVSVLSADRGIPTIQRWNS
jgi:broad specificity phosphatase PhoE